MRFNVAAIWVLSLASTGDARIRISISNSSATHNQLRHTPPRKPGPAKEASKIVALDKQLGEADEQVKSKVKELKVQADLEKEKEVAALQVEKQVSELHQRAEKLQKEAEVAAEIAKEKAEAASKAKHEMEIAGNKASSVLAQEAEMQKVLNSTKKEEAVLEQHVVMLQHERAEALLAQRAAQLSNASNRLNASNVSGASAPHAANASRTVKAAQATPAASRASDELHKLHVSLPTHGKANDTISLSQAMQKLVEENQRLKREKDELQRQLTAKKVAQEKSLFRQKLKNRLALADRHLKSTARHH